MVSRLSNRHIVTLRTLWNMQDIVHIGHNDKPGTKLLLRHCGLEYTSHHNNQLQWHHTDHQYNEVCTKLGQQSMSKQCNILHYDKNVMNSELNVMQ